MGRRPCWWFDQ